MGNLLENINTLISDTLESRSSVIVSILCSNCISRLSGNPHVFPISELEKGIAAGSLYIRCPDCGDNVRLDNLVPDLAMTGALNSSSMFNYSELNINRELGKEGYAIVYQGNVKGKEVAVKQLIINDSDVGSTNFSEYFAEFRRKVWLMSGMQHENIVTLVGICNKPLCMILEFCGGGNLYDWAHKRQIPSNEQEFAESEKFAIDVAKGMEFLHLTKPPIIHRDLKTPNILLARTKQNELVAKIADFGLSRGLVWSQDLKGKVVDNPVWLPLRFLKNNLILKKLMSMRLVLFYGN